MNVTASPTHRPGPGTAGALAGGVALLVLLAGFVLSGANGLLELVANGATTFVPLAVFDAILGLLGPFAKSLLFVLVAAAVPVAGGLLGLALARWGGLGPSAGLGIAALASGVALLIAEVVVLPLFGQGLLGSGYRGDPLALQLPIVGAAMAYGLVLVGIIRSTAPDDDSPSAMAPDPSDAGVSRRSLLGRSLIVLGGLSLAGSAAIVATRVVGAVSKPLGPSTGRPLVDDWGATHRITPPEDLYVVGKDLLPTTVDLATWRLRIDGLVTTPAEWTLDDLRGLPRVEGPRTLQCISNEVIHYGSLIGNQWWAGCRMRDVLDAVGPTEAARFVLWRAADGFTESLPIDVARDERTWLVWEMGSPGTPLPIEHGFPLRVFVAGRYGMKQPKYLTGIELADHDEDGYWVVRGWDRTAAVRTYSRIDVPARNDQVAAGSQLRVYGIASAGDRGIARVEVSGDDGTTWSDAELEPESPDTSDLTWRRWRATLVLSAGRPVIVARATDRAGNVQDEVVRPTLPSGATGFHRVPVIAT
jgi:DMSO/TMAO reductase YedYZ molybdopterin-dependent catalytic subunit